MAALATLIEEVLIAVILRDQRLRPQKNKTDWALIVLSVLLGCVAFLFFILGLYRFLQTLYTPEASAFLLAGILLLGMCMISFFFAHIETKSDVTSWNIGSRSSSEC